MRPSATARRYAEAAFDVAQQTGDVEVWAQDLHGVQDALDRQVVAQYFEDPNIARDDRLDMLPRMFPRVRPQVLNLLRILAVRHRMHLIPALVAQFDALVQRSRGVMEAAITVARPIEDAERQAIAQRLSHALGKQVEIHTEVDPAIIGGIVVRVGDQLIDASVSGRLQRLRQELAV